MHVCTLMHARMYAYVSKYVICEVLYSSKLAVSLFNDC